MLQLRYQECVPAWLHTSQVGYSGSAALSSAVCIYAFLEGYELGCISMATLDRRSIIPGVAGLFAFGPGATARTPLESPNDCQVRRDVERQR